VDLEKKIKNYGEAPADKIEELKRIYGKK